MKEAINVGKLIRQQCKFNVSKQAVQEYIDRIKVGIEINIPQIEKIAKNKGKKTVQEDDVLEFFGFVETTTTPTKEKQGNLEEWFS